MEIFPHSNSAPHDVLLLLEPLLGVCVALIETLTQFGTT